MSKSKAGLGMSTSESLRFKPLLAKLENPVEKEGCEWLLEMVEQKLEHGFRCVFFPTLKQLLLLLSSLISLSGEKVESPKAEFAETGLGIGDSGGVDQLNVSLHDRAPVALTRSFLLGLTGVQMDDGSGLQLAFIPCSSLGSETERHKRFLAGG